MTQILKISVNYQTDHFILSSNSKMLNKKQHNQRTVLLNQLYGPKFYNNCISRLNLVIMVSLLSKSKTSFWSTSTSNIILNKVANKKQYLVEKMAKVE